jgi:hypothetical protein
MARLQHRAAHTNISVQAFEKSLFNKCQYKSKSQESNGCDADSKELKCEGVIVIELTENEFVSEVNVLPDVSMVCNVGSGESKEDEEGCVECDKEAQVVPCALNSRTVL